MFKITQDLGILRQKSEPVDSVREAKDIIDKLEKVLSKTDNGFGLGAIQIGIPKQVAVIKFKNRFFHLINPVVEVQMDRFIFINEGCLSMPGRYLDTERYKQIVIRNKKIEGDEFTDEELSFYYSSDPHEIGNDGLICIAIQHELDHFEGRLISDYNIEPQIIQRKDKKVGRNDPCPCGSGKKFKKCCLVD